MSYLRSVRFPDEVREPMQEEAAKAGVSVNRLISLTMLQVLEGKAAKPKMPKPPAVKPRRPSAPKGPKKKRTPPTGGAAGKPGPKKPVIECRHGIENCRLCMTGRYAK